ncbi:helix-hairpin-helix domain-containing protein, partial [Thermococcus sp.]|uniref:helix-hairpin-helix domain-containing protein n=1 Tax=Thermococcus sp. TaxID=35749 RepID=UPI0026352DCA
VIVGHGFRSITGIPIPVNINIESSKVLSYLPGLGKKRIIKILAQRPFKNKEEFLKMLDPREREFYEKITKI